MSVKNTSFCPIQTLNCGGRIVDLSSPKVMGILNLTPDSFFKSTNYKDEKEIIRHVENMLSEGADMIDIGGASSRPGAPTVSEVEELKRVIPLIKLLSKKFPETVFSIDTCRARVAREAVCEGVGMVNDISGGVLDTELFKILPKLQVPYVLMHMQGIPQTMQNNPVYKDLIPDIIDFFIEKVEVLKSLGMKDIILDPGIGFGKTVAHNYSILKNLHNFKIFGLPILMGLSRKSMICKVLKTNPQQALNGTTALHAITLLKGAHILRTHDVKEACEVIKIIEFYQSV